MTYYVLRYYLKAGYVRGSIGNFLFAFFFAIPQVAVPTTSNECVRRKSHELQYTKTHDTHAWNG